MSLLPPDATPAVSVVIPLYNHARYIAAAIDSVRAQTFTDWELIVIDDGSRDGSAEVVERLLAQHPDARIHLHRQANAGSHATINRGLALARGEYLAVLNSDDLFAPDRLAVLVERARRHERPEFLGVTPVRLIDGQGRAVTPADPAGWWLAMYQGITARLARGQSPRDVLLWGNFTVSTSNFFLSRAAWEKLGPLGHFRYVLDWEYALRAAIELPGALCWLEGRPLLDYRLHGGNTILGGAIRNHVEAAFVLRTAQRRVLALGQPVPAEALLRVKYLDRFVRQEQARLHDAERARMKVAHDRLAQERDEQVAGLHHQLQALHAHADGLAGQLRAMEASRSWRLTAPLREAGTLARRIRGRLRRELSRVRAFGRRLLGRATGQPVAPTPAAAYDLWLAQEAERLDALQAEAPQRLARLPRQPLVSVVVPVFNTEPAMLDTMIASVLAQAYPNLELCLCDDASTRAGTLAVLERHAAADDRVRVLRRARNGHIVRATNEAIAAARGEIIAFADHDDLLAPQALLRMVEASFEVPAAGAFYSDEDKVDDRGRRSLPLFKPDWSPALAWSQNYVGHLLCVRREALQAVGGLREGLEGSQDHDLVLRLAAAGVHFHHVPEVLYHWRQHEASTASNAGAKPYAHDAGARAVEDHLRTRYGERFARLETPAYTFVHQPRFALPGRPLVSIIIPTRDRIDLLAPCIDSILERSTWANFEVIVIDNGSAEPASKAYFAGLPARDARLKVVDAPIDFNWSRLNNIGVRHAAGEFLVFLNNDTLVITPDWLERLVEVAALPDVGTVGPLLLFEDGTIQHAGVVVGMGGWADHVFRGAEPVHFPSPYVSAMVPRNVLAVTGACVAIERAKFERLGGFDESFIICGSDVEIGLRAHRAGLQNLYWPQVRLTHLESKTRTPHVPEPDFVQSRLKYAPFRTEGDPFYNPNLDAMSQAPRPLHPASPRRMAVHD
ncbi:glycosyltransferase [Ramlibacter sp. MAHUQ-53]|uniref:glycosyltransferase n=1 Tax=unclassified Ramlibacter TaxID=2617605 RepID=UPI0036375426